MSFSLFYETHGEIVNKQISKHMKNCVFVKKS